MMKVRYLGLGVKNSTIYNVIIQDYLTNPIGLINNPRCRGGGEGFIIPGLTLCCVCLVDDFLRILACDSSPVDHHLRFFHANPRYKEFYTNQNLEDQQSQI